jgi:sugar/nucleoside kinase (ribokinase family)
MSLPDFLVIGHITKDVVPEGYTVGGTVTYSSITARNLGRRTAILTAADPEFEPGPLLDGITLLRLPSTATTTFQNLYPDGYRVQYLRARAASISSAALPADWLKVPIIHLGPLTQELPPDIGTCFPRALIGVTPQGWMRQWDGDGRVRPTPWLHAAEVMASAEVLVFSREDVAGDEDLIEQYARLARIMVVTEARRGATLYYRGERRRFPAFVAREVDPTGAGDVFAAAFLIRLHETHDPAEATHFANCVASFCVEAPGVTGIPTRAQVEDRLRSGRMWES